MTLCGVDLGPRRFVGWVTILLAAMGVALVAALIVFVRGLVVTNLTNLVPWGLWIAMDLSAIGLSAGAFLLSAAVYLLRLKHLEPVARTSVFVGLIGYSMAMMTLLLDIGRPDRFWHSYIHWNIHSPLWEVTMCVTLYFTVLSLEVAPIFGQAAWFQQRWPKLAHRLEHLHKLAPYLAVIGLCLSTLHHSSLGSTYGVLRARPVWYRPSLAVLFYVSAIAAGPALSLFLSKAAAYLTPRAHVRRELIDPVARFIGWVLLVYFGLRVWDLLSIALTHQPGRSEGLAMLMTGSLSFNFWVLELALGIVVPMVILLSGRLRQQDRLLMLALGLAVVGLIAYRWDTNMVGQLVVVPYNPQSETPLYTTYTPSVVETAVGAGVVAYGMLAFTLAVRFLNIVDHRNTGHMVADDNGRPNWIQRGTKFLRRNFVPATGITF
jgi:Ni/Fe-hydrogenase subunit HybB-like protein